MNIWRRGDTELSEHFKIAALSTTEFAQSGAEFPPELLLYEWEELVKFRESSKLAKDIDDSKSSFKVAEALSSRGQNRQLMTIRPTFRADLDNLQLRFPNFSEVIAYIRCCAEIAWRTDKVLRFTPILLNGDGGVGKTMFTEALASWMGHGFHRISISSSQNGSDLAGSSAFWSNAKPGIPFTALLFSEIANPVIFLDEIDKNSTGQFDALGALYVLLEPLTAKTYTDLCYPLPINTTGLLWVSACNDSNLLNPALRSRFREFNIRITPEQSRKIAEAIVFATLSSLAPATDGMTFSTVAMDSLATMTPRRIKQAVTESIGQAFAENAMVIDAVPSPVSTKRTIGFVQ